MENYILIYYQMIKDGRANVGKWTLLLYEYIIKGLEDGLFFYDNKKAHRKIRWIETHTHHVKGKWAPKTIKLEIWQKAALSCMYGIVDENGLRQFREVLWLLGRKNGKSSIAAGVIGDAVFDDDEYGADVFCVAPKVDQADIVYEAFWQSVLLDDELKELTKPKKGYKYVPSTNSSIKKIPFSAKRSDGYNPHLGICDEIAAWPGEQGLRQYEVMTSALGSREQPIIFSITTAGYISGGIFDELLLRATRVLLGDSKERRFLPIIYMIDDVGKWNDINEVIKANPNIDVSVSRDYLLEQIAIAEGSPSKKAEFLCKHCNVKQNSSLAWLPIKAIEDISGEAIDMEMLRGSYCVCGLDLSQTTDLSAAVALVEKEGVLYVVSHFWLPSEKIEEATERDGVPYNQYIQKGYLSESGDNFIDYHDIYQWFVDLIEKYELYPLQTGYDRYSAQYLVSDMKSYGFHMDDVYQGDNLWGVLQEMEGIIKDRKLYIGDNALMKIHLLNAAIKMNTERGRGKLVKINPTGRIDGTAALSDAFCVRQKWYSEIGGQLKN